jgi:Domain of unknown function (DUF4062)
MSIKNQLAPRRQVKIGHDDLERYLLNETQDRAVASAIAKRLDAEANFVEEARAVEDELIIQYAANRLKSPRRAQFERYFLTSPEKRQRLQFVQLMMRALDEPGIGKADHEKPRLRVFLSSTQSDLVDERRTVLDVLTRLQVRHGSMEFFGARQDYPLETCLHEVRRSDLILLLIGSRYGSLARKVQKSFTEMEYREAYRLGKECLVYCRDDATRILPSQMEQDPRLLERLVAFKRLVLKRHTVAHFSDSNHLAAIVAADVATTIVRNTELRRIALTNSGKDPRTSC